MSELMPEEMTQIRPLDVNFGIEELSAVDQQAGLAALAALAQKLARDGDGSSLIGWTSGQVSRSPAWLAQDRPAEMNDLSAKLPSQQDRRTDGSSVPAVPQSVTDTGMLSLEVMRRSVGAVGKADRVQGLIA